jgi:hypothetical protein
LLLFGVPAFFKPNENFAHQRGMIAPFYLRSTPKKEKVTVSAFFLFAFIFQDISFYALEFLG